ncbi:MAG: hypothetical protein AB1757_07995 [Acidobacteriota bacterium]
MFETLSHISALSVFLALGAIGFLFLLASFLLGEVFGHFDIDQDIDVEHDFSHDLAHDGPGIFNARIISMFITAFGGCGAISVYLGLSVLVSSLIGLAGGFLFGWLVYLFARFLYSQQASSIHQATDLIGLTAQVIVAIPTNGLGQVRCIVGESAIEKIARSTDGNAIAENTTVFVEAISGETAVVSPQPEPGAGWFLTDRSA